MKHPEFLPDIFRKYLSERECPDTAYLAQHDQVIASAKAALPLLVGEDRVSLKEVIMRLEERAAWLSRDLDEQLVKDAGWQELMISPPRTIVPNVKDEPLKATYDLIAEHSRSRQETLHKITHPEHQKALLKAHELYDLCVRYERSDQYHKHVAAFREYCDEAMRVARNVLPTERGGTQEREESAKHLGELLNVMFDDTKHPTPRQSPPVAAPGDHDMWVRKKLFEALDEEKHRSLDFLIPEHRELAWRGYHMYSWCVQRKSDGLRETCDEAMADFVNITNAKASRVQMGMPGGSIIVERSAEHLKRVLNGLLDAYRRDKR